MQMTSRSLSSLLMTTALMVAATPPPAAEPATASAGSIFVRAKFESYAPSTKTITYTSSKGTYSATWIGVRRYRLRGTISGRRLRGTIRTRPRPGGTRYAARGSGHLGPRRVTISGGGPNNLRTAKLVLR